MMHGFYVWQIWLQIGIHLWGKSHKRKWICQSSLIDKLTGRFSFIQYLNYHHHQHHFHLLLPGSMWTWEKWGFYFGAIFQGKINVLFVIILGTKNKSLKKLFLDIWLTIKNYTNIPKKKYANICSNNYYLSILL